jgi:hypothetical protein
MGGQPRDRSQDRGDVVHSSLARVNRAYFAILLKSIGTYRGLL